MIPRIPRSQDCLVDKYINSDFDKVAEVSASLDEVVEVSNAIPEIDKVAGNLDEIVEVANGMKNYQVVETFVLTQGQTTIQLTNINAHAAILQIMGQMVDGETLLEGQDYTIDDSSKITLIRSYPTGSTLKVTQAVYKTDDPIVVVDELSAFNRKLVTIAVGADISPYEEDDRTLYPRLLVRNKSYVNVDPIEADTLITTATVTEQGEGVISVQTNQGVKRFSRVEAEAVTRQDINVAYVGSIAEAKMMHFCNIIRVIIPSLGDAMFERVSENTIGGFRDVSGQYWGLKIDAEVRVTWLGASGIVDYALGDANPDDTQAIKAALELAHLHNATLLLDGIFHYRGPEELEITKPITIKGLGVGNGYGSDALLDYQMKSGLLVTGVGNRRVRTRVLHRANSSSPEDAPLSCIFNNQAARTVFADFDLFLWFDRSNNNPTNYGSEWDIGIFNGCRDHVRRKRVNILGYWREACIWYDVTHATNLPRFNSLSGQSYPNVPNISGADGCYTEDCFDRGGKWGIKVQGAKPAIGNTEYGPQYYDTVSGLVSDYRGTFGSSDFTIQAGAVYGRDHHSNVRSSKATGDYLTDLAGGAISISGMASNSSKCIQGFRFFSTRFASWEPYRMKLDYCNRPVLIGCHTEYRSGDISNPDGTKVKFDDTDTYGPISATDITDNIVVIAPAGAYRPAFIPSNVSIDYMYNAGSNNTSVTSHILDAQGGIRNSTAALDIRGKGGIRLRDDTTTIANFTSSGITVSSPISCSTAGDFDLRAASNQKVRLRSGSTTLALIGSDSSSISTGVFAPDVDNITNLGSSTRRWKKVYSATAVIDEAILREGDKMYRLHIQNGMLKTVELSLEEIVSLTEHTIEEY